jgi:hypothetical protein
MRNWVYIDQGYQKAEHCTAFMRFKGLLTGRHYGDGAVPVSLLFTKHSSTNGKTAVQHIKKTSVKSRKTFYFTGVLTSRYYGDGTGSVRKPGITSYDLLNVL